MTIVDTPHCLDCGTQLSREPWAVGLCPHCLVELALEESSAVAEELDDLETEATLEYPSAASHGEPLHEALAGQQILGERYQVRSLLGRGGMGEVWRAYDLKLRVDVALKALRTELLREARALETLRQEVRVAREVISPNVCRVYDLEELDGQELVSMEYVDGTTLQEILRERGPLELDEAREIASQFLAGLEAIHEAGLVHRDIKPENMMITRTGRVVVMDFGIAKGLQEGKGGVVAGTPAYMSPEQARGTELDARGDLFSAGVVLAEMVEPGGVGSFEDRRRLWEGLHQESPRVSATPWSKVIAKSVAPERGERFASAAALTRALEEVTLRAAGDEEARPYPGLSAFQEEDARFFFGRELEVEAVWKKLRRPHLLAVIGPSGAGKSSFLRAGLLPTLTDGWRAIVATPGNRPFGNLARQLAPELGDDPNIVDRLLRFEELDVAVELLSEWRQQVKHGLLIVDQFEELFTQNPPEIQGRFAELLGRLPLETDLHVLLSMRDDFLFHCQSFEALSPVFSEMTPLGPPTGASLRRAIVEPALRCGYRFEEESMVEEMLAEVEGERGALPMVAFTAAQLWERRDRETGYLTRNSYEQIGGVSGALAQYAEAILDYIGEANVPIVRELFRNLVTAQGTRAARDREELLSVFSSTEGEPFLEPSRVQARPGPPAERPAALHVLNALIDARLLTSFEVPSDETGSEPHQRIEIVHESLLKAWPRLVRWQMQDAEGAQLRDQLRQAAQLWQERQRSDDLLWTGTAFQEFQLWRERYAGGLTKTEDDFASAMTAKAKRRRQRRQVAFASALVLVTAVAMVTGTLWRRSETARRQAIVAEQEATAQARRAEASKLLALGRVELDRDPTIALAHALASLELADSAAARRFALEALWRGPAYFGLPPTGSPPAGIDFSPDERWLAVGYGGTGDIHIWSRAGGEPTRIQGHGGIPRDLRFSANSDVLVSATTMDVDNTVRVWSVPEGDPLLVAEGTADPDWRNWVGIMPAHISADGGRLVTYQPNADWTLGRLQAWPLDGVGPKDLGVFASGAPPWAIDPSGRWLLHWSPPPWDLRILPTAQIESANPRVVDHQPEGASDCGWDLYGQRIACETSGEIRIWSVEPDSTSLVRSLRAPAKVWAGFRFDDSGSRLAAGHDEGLVCLWDLSAPVGADPLTLKYASENDVDGITLQPSGRWLAATNDEGGVRLWPLGRTYPWVLRGHEAEARGVAFAPDATWIASQGFDGYRYWPLTQEFDEAPWEAPLRPSGPFAFDPAGRFIVFAPRNQQVRLLPIGGGESRAAPAPEQIYRGVALSPDGAFVAWGGGLTDKSRVIRAWDLHTDEVRLLDAGREEAINLLEFAPDGRLLAAYGPLSTSSSASTLGGGPLRRWNVEEGTQEILMDAVERFDLSRDGRFMLTVEGGQAYFRDLQQGRATELPGLEAQGNTTSLALDPTGTIAVSGSEEGVLRVAPVTGEEPHLLMGHEGSVHEVAVSPDGRWIASAGADATIRLWPMPEGRPFHTLPYDELLTNLRSLTNLRVVQDSATSTGWKIELGPFPGWEEVPTW